MQSVELLSKLKSLATKGNDFIDSLPVSIGSSFFDNEYSSSQGMINDLLISTVFGANAELVFEFLFDTYSDLYNKSAEEVVELFQKV